MQYNGTKLPSQLGPWLLLPSPPNSASGIISVVQVSCDCSCRWFGTGFCTQEPWRWFFSPQVMSHFLLRLSLFICRPVLAYLASRRTSFSVGAPFDMCTVIQSSYHGGRDSVTVTPFIGLLSRAINLDIYCDMVCALHLLFDIIRTLASYFSRYSPNFGLRLEQLQGYSF